MLRERAAQNELRVAAQLMPAAPPPSCLTMQSFLDPDPRVVVQEE